MSTEMIIMMIGLGLVHKALDESGKETFTKALTDFCESFSKKKKENKEAELAELGILPKSGIS